MGCNYYAIQTKKIAELEVQKDAKIKEAGNLVGLLPLIREYYDSRISQLNEVHIGKASYGWMFCFNHNNWKYFDQSKDSLKNFLSDCDIVDEYQSPITNEEFWGMVKEKENGMAHLIWEGDQIGTMQFGLNFSDSTDFF